MLLFFWVAFLASCIVPPSTYVTPTFHLLTKSSFKDIQSFRQGTDTDEDNQTTEGQSFYLRQIELPYYLQENRIVTRPEVGKIEFRENDRWGEPLIEGIGRVTGLNLSGFLKSPFYSVYPHREKIGTPWEVAINVLRFERISEKEVLLEASWEIFHNGFRNGTYSFKNDNVKIKVDIYSTPSNPELVEDVVDALSKSLGTLAEKISRTIIDSDISEL